MPKLSKKLTDNTRIEADNIVAELIDRLMKTEKRVDEFQHELNECKEMIAEQQGQLGPDGNVKMLVMKSDGENAEQVTVTLAIPTQILAEKSL